MAMHQTAWLCNFIHY